MEQSVRDDPCSNVGRRSRINRGDREAAPLDTERSSFTALLESMQKLARTSLRRGNGQ
uniref:Uncharacterized protein n=1 Tax=Peronospora matthiolae TaxID=2874970 RepID=A0AAV1T5N0_9STRA